MPGDVRQTRHQTITDQRFEHFMGGSEIKIWYKTNFYAGLNMVGKSKTTPIEGRPCRMAVTCDNDDLQARIVPMARSRFFIIFEGEPKNHLVMENLVKKAGSESGLKVASELAKQDLDIVITGTIGPRAFKHLEAAGIKVHAGCDGNKVSDILDKCLKGKLPVCKKATYGGYLGI